MPSIKNRINLTVPVEMGRALERIAKRDESTVATSALELIRRALEVEEDDALLAVAEKRDAKKIRYTSHARAWK